MANTLPTDDEILAALQGHAWLATYVVKNAARRRHPTVKTPWILRQLKRLEKEGRVRRVQTNYISNLCWAVVKEATHG